MAFSVSITGSGTTKIDQATSYTAAVTDAPADGTLSYAWTVDSATQASTTSTFSYTPTSAGTKAVKVVVTSTPSSGDPVDVEATKSVVVSKKTNSASLSITPSPATVEVNKSITFTATISNQPSGASAAISWYVDGVVQTGKTAATFAYTPSAAGSKTIKCQVIVTATDYEDKTVEATSTLTVTEAVAPVPTGELPYVHPLPSRNSAYIWCGWWVMDEIQQMALDGKDWKTDDADSKYYLHRYMLQKMITDYPEVDVQESRNGRIVHKTALEAGIIY